MPAAAGIKVEAVPGQVFASLQSPLRGAQPAPLRLIHWAAMTLVVKLGSSIVAADDGALRTDVLDSACEQVATLERGGERIVMVTSGAIARGMNLMGLPVRPRAMDELQAASAVGQGDLFRAYESRLAGHGTRAAQVLLTAADIAARTNYLNARQTLRRLIEWGVVPVVNENDTTATDEITFGDNDFLAAQVAILLEARLLVLLTNTDGLHTADPAVDPTAERIAEVANFAELDGLEIGDRTSAFGSGGMRSKVAAAEMASEAGIPATICDGTSAGSLAAAATGGSAGTRFAALGSKASSFKLWLKYAKPVRGRLLVDDGAASVLRKSGSSLLPVGVTAVEGEFDAGDAVEVAANGVVVGKGIVDYSAPELSRVIGLKSAEVRERLPHAADEVIHRDRFVLV
jgi:glutamate 5-kinase